MKVDVRSEKISLPTYEVGQPEKNPVFFEKRVYQGSNGKVYPVPFVDKVSDFSVNKDYRTEIIENEFVRLMMLPEIGGRIFEAKDKTNHNYDYFYKQDVIKPALVGLAETMDQWWRGIQLATAPPSGHFSASRCIYRT